MAMDKLAIVAVASITLGVIVVRCSDAHDAETSTAQAKKQTFHGDQSNLWLWQSRLRGYLKAAEDDSTRSVRNENGMAVY